MVFHHNGDGCVSKRLSITLLRTSVVCSFFRMEVKQIAGTQSRKWQLTINNPADKGLDHERIKLALGQFKGLVYWALSDEVGLDTKTPHTHIFFCLKSPAMFSTVKNRFPDAHIEAARGSISENRDYVAKTGKWENDPKSDTRVDGTFE